YLFFGLIVLGLGRLGLLLYTWSAGLPQAPRRRNPLWFNAFLTPFCLMGLGFLACGVDELATWWAETAHVVPMHGTLESLEVMHSVRSRPGSSSSSSNWYATVVYRDSSGVERRFNQPFYGDQQLRYDEGDSVPLVVVPGDPPDAAIQGTHTWWRTMV